MATAAQPQLSVSVAAMCASPLAMASGADEAEAWAPFDSFVLLWSTEVLLASFSLDSHALLPPFFELVPLSFFPVHHLVCSCITLLSWPPLPTITYKLTLTHRTNTPTRFHIHNQLTGANRRSRRARVAVGVTRARRRLCARRVCAQRGTDRRCTAAGMCILMRSFSRTDKEQHAKKSIYIWWFTLWHHDFVANGLNS
jgi:hypothetical protein